MRIIGGNNKGKKLKTFEGYDIRPTSDRAKESLFNILSTKILGCDFLDLCCGTGSVGLESYSRGCKIVTFVDVNKKSLSLTKENAKSIGCEGNFYLSTAEDFVKRRDKSFDIIFFDPPYAFDGIDKILASVKENNLLNKEGIFVYERSRDKQSVIVDGFDLYQSRKYGLAVFDFYREKKENL